MKYKIYKIVDKTNGNVYIGQTIQTLKQRIGRHKCDFKNKSDYNNCSSKLILCNEDWYYELVEETDDKSREKYWIQNTPSCINKIKYDFNDEVYMKKYRLDNKTKIDEQMRQYYIKNKTKIDENAKQYRLDNKTKINEGQKRYVLKNKILVYEKKKETYFMNKFGNVIYKYLLDMDLL